MKLHPLTPFSHSQERSGDQLNYTNADNAYTLAQVFILYVEELRPITHPQPVYLSP